MELTKENIVALVKQINERLPDNTFGASKVLLNPYFDNEEEEARRLAIEEEIKFDYESTIADYKGWLKRCRFRNKQYKKMEALIDELKQEGLIVSSSPRNENGVVIGPRYFYKDYSIDTEI
jgi:hypothetical protein